MSGYWFSVGTSGYGDEDRLANRQCIQTLHAIVARHSVSEFDPAIYFQDGQQIIAE